MNELLRSSVGTVWSRHPPIYRPVADCSARRMSLFICIIGPTVGCLPTTISYTQYSGKAREVKYMFQADLLQDKVILVTGGGTGLGRAMGERFLELGAKLAICGRRQEVAEQAAADMARTKGGETFATRCDVRHADQVETMMEAVIERFGRIDVLVNNAAGNFISPTERLSTRAVDAVLGIVLHGTFYCTLALGKRWLEQGQSGTMLNIVTTYAWTGSGYVVPSAAAKAGVLALTRSLAVEWGPKGQYISNRKKGESRRQRMALSVILQRERCQVQQSRKDQPSDVQSTLPGTN